MTAAFRQLDPRAPTRRPSAMIASSSASEPRLPNSKFGVALVAVGLREGRKSHHTTEFEAVHVRYASAEASPASDSSLFLIAAAAASLITIARGIVMTTTSLNVRQRGPPR